MRLTFRKCATSRASQRFSTGASGRSGFMRGPCATAVALEPRQSCRRSRSSERRGLSVIRDARSASLDGFQPRRAAGLLSRCLSFSVHKQENCQSKAAHHESHPAPAPTSQCSPARRPGSPHSAAGRTMAAVPLVAMSTRGSARRSGEAACLRSFAARRPRATSEAAAGERSSIAQRLSGLPAVSGDMGWPWVASSGVSAA
jgi:hypothetical protein